MPEAVAMLFAGVVVVGVGIVSVAAGALWRERLGRAMRARHLATGAVSAVRFHQPDPEVSIEGAVVVTKWLLSPVTATRCLFFEVEVIARWRTGTATHAKLVLQERAAACFAVDDGSGAAFVRAAQGGEFDTKEVFRARRARGVLAAITGRPLVFGDHGYTVAQGVTVDGQLIPDSAEFEVVENVIADASSLYVHGSVDDTGVVGPARWAPLILSRAPRRKVIARSASMARSALGMGVALIGVGLLWAFAQSVYAQLLSGPH